MKEVKVRHSKLENTTFRKVSLIVMILVAITCLLPFVLMISASITSEKELINEGYKFWPKTVSFETYKYLWAKRETIGRAYLMSILVTLVGTLTNLVITSLFAYPLYRKAVLEKIAEVYPWLYGECARQMEYAPQSAQRL